jgi:hypothetical protein
MSARSVPNQLEVTVKTFRGTIANWSKLVCDPKPLPAEKESNLGYMVVGVFEGRNWRTSPVVKHEEGQIETLNSIYLLTGEENAQEQQ